MAEEHDINTEEMDGQQEQGPEQDGADAQIEAEARANGWVPESEWDAARAEREGRRRPAVFKSAADYLADVRGNMSRMRHHNESLSSEVVGLKKKVDEMHDILLSQRSMGQEAVKRAREQAYTQAREDMRKAAETGDVDAYKEAEQRADTVARETQQAEVRPAQAAQQQRPAAPDPAIMAWVNANPWFNSNATLNSAMVNEDSMLAQQFPDMDTASRLEQAAERVKRRYSEFFPAHVPQTKRQGAVTAPTNGRTAPAGSVDARFNALPKDVRDTYERFRKQFAEKGVAFTKEEYLSDYAL